MLIALFCYTWLEHEHRQQGLMHRELNRQLMELKNAHIEALKRNENLLKQINSQSDPAWVELTLIKVLGLVPENQTKIYFPDDA